MVTHEIDTLTSVMDDEYVSRASTTIDNIKQAMAGTDIQSFVPDTPEKNALLQMCILEGAQRQVSKMEFRMVIQWYTEFLAEQEFTGNKARLEVTSWNDCLANAIHWHSDAVIASVSRAGRRISRRMGKEIMANSGVISVKDNGAFEVSNWNEYVTDWDQKHIYEVSPIEMAAIRAIVKDSILKSALVNLGFVAEDASPKEVAAAWYGHCEQFLDTNLVEIIEEAAEKSFAKMGLDEHWCDRKNSENNHLDAIALMSNVKSLFSIEVYNDMVNRYEHLTPLFDSKQTGIVGIWLSRVMRGSRENNWMSNMNHTADLISMVRESTSMDKINWKRLVRMPIEEVVEDMWELTDIDRDFETFTALFKMETKAAVRPSRIAYDTVKRNLFPEQNRRTGLQSEYVRLATPEHYTNLVVEYWKKSVDDRNGPVDQGALMERFEIILDWALHHLLRDIDAENMEDIGPDDIPELAKYSWRRYTDEANRWNRDQIVAQRERERVKYLEDTKVKWDSPLKQYEVGDYSVVPLINRAMMIQEGTKMDHCIGSGGYTNQCVEGVTRIFSIRKTDDLEGRPLGTAQITLRGGNNWSLAQLRGPHNHAVTPAIQAIGDNISRLYAEATNAADA